jgi:hypothetical protein
VLIVDDYFLVPLILLALDDCLLLSDHVVTWNEDSLEEIAIWEGSHTFDLLNEVFLAIVFGIVSFISELLFGDVGLPVVRDRKFILLWCVGFLGM